MKTEVNITNERSGDLCWLHALGASSSRQIWSKLFYSVNHPIGELLFINEMIDEAHVFHFCLMHSEFRFTLGKTH